jgi:broad specificity phosphatase PhoE
MKIYLVRHGESEFNVDKSLGLIHPDHSFDLTSLGYNQANRMAEFLYEHLRADTPKKLRIWTSPYQRARETAQAIHSRLQYGINNHCYDGSWCELREHINLVEQQFGLFDGIPDGELPERYPDEQAHYQKHMDEGGRFWARMPLGESRFDVAIRVHASFGTFQRDNDRHGLRDIIIVSHGVTIRAFIMQWLHLSPEWFEEEPNPKNCSVRLLEDGEDKGYIYEGG